MQKINPASLIAASLVLATATVSAQPRTVPPPQVPPPVGVTAVAPLAVCSGSSQAEFCANNAWVAQRRAAELATPPPPAPETAEARRTRQQECVRTICSGESGDTHCTCACRGEYLNPATNACSGLSGTVEGLTAVAVNHEARIAALEARAGVSSTRVTASAASVRARIRRERRRRH